MDTSAFQNLNCGGEDILVDRPRFSSVPQHPFNDVQGRRNECQVVASPLCQRSFNLRLIEDVVHGLTADAFFGFVAVAFWHGSVPLTAPNDRMPQATTSSANAQSPMLMRVCRGSRPGREKFS